MSDRIFEGRTAVVSGGGSGIGLATARRLLHDGASVLLLGRDATLGAQAVAELQSLGPVRFQVADVRSREAVEAAWAVAEETFGLPDLVLANAGVGVVTPLIDTGDEDWHWTWQTNVDGCLYLCQTAMRRLRDAGRPGSLVLVASDAGVIGERSIGAYSVSKGAVVMMSRVLALDGGPLGIRVNCVCPGYVGAMRHLPDRTVAATGEDGGGYTDAPYPPLGRYGTPDDIAANVRYLFSDEAAWITGTVSLVEGGATAGLP